ncbi:MAG TPA: ferric reductase-like transmembrane domain-containing protein [Candidatus Saccharimonadaceae bacterium]|nr:ferric reductase-like transmembrane domain-containing protein [Candidatus Saccharimonadaceae bacterium]
MDAPKLRVVDNSRFYIIALAVLVSVAVFAWLRLQTPSDQLLVITTEQVFGFIAAGALYATLIISPIRAIFGERKLKRLLYARRGFGLATFYFAWLHGGIALFGQLGGFADLHFLPSIFLWSLAGGAVALTILTIMALTPSDQLIPHISYRAWKSIHRFVYLAGILIILHVWLIGSDITTPIVLVISYSLLVILAGLETARAIRAVNHRYHIFDRGASVALGIMAWVIVAVALLVMPVFVPNFQTGQAHLGGHTKSSGLMPEMGDM